MERIRYDVAEYRERRYQRAAFLLSSPREYSLGRETLPFLYLVPKNLKKSRGSGVGIQPRVRFTGTRKALARVESRVTFALTLLDLGIVRLVKITGGFSVSSQVGSVWTRLRKHLLVNNVNRP